MEIRKAFFSMYPNKAAGTDGMSSFFSQKFWNTVKNDDVNVMRAWRPSKGNVCFALWI